MDAEIAATQKRNARMLNVDRPAEMGDTANINFEGFLNGEPFEGGKGENHPLELGSNSFVPGFEEQLVGMTIGEEKDLDITFPEDYTENLAGKAVVFKVKLNGISYAELPELDDEFAKDVSEFDTLEEYKADLREKLQKRYDDQAESAFRASVMKKAADNMTVTVPAVMIDEKVEEIIRNYAANFGMADRSMPMDQLCSMLGLNEQILSESIRPNAEMQVKNDLLLEAVAKEENFELTDEETEAYIKRISESVNASPDEVREYFGMDFIASEQKKEKATELICSSAVAVAPAAEEEKSAEEPAE